MAKCKLIRSSIPAKIAFTEEFVAWTNPNPTASTFAAQDITLDISACPDYDDVIVECAFNASASLKLRGSKGKTIQFSITGVTTGVYTKTYYRNVLYSSDTKLTIADAYEQASNGSRSVNNGAFIPKKVWIRKINVTADVNAIASSVKTNAQNCMMSDNVTSVESEITTLKSAKVNRVTLTKTTNASGYFTLPISTYKHPISAVPTDAADLLFIYKGNPTEWVVWALKYDMTGKDISKSITFDLYYQS